MSQIRTLKQAPFSVGILRQSYPEKRNIMFASDFGVSHQLVHDRLEILQKLHHRFSGVGYSSKLHCFSATNYSRTASIIHSFNTIVLGFTPWIVTYETTLPRTTELPNSLIRFAWQRLASSRCIGAISLSQCSYDRLLKDLQSNCPAIDTTTAETIIAKVEVLHPPQRILAEEKTFVETKAHWQGPLRLAVVGHDFYRKGGLEVLLAMDTLVRAGKDIVLQIAGRMAAGDYASRAGAHEIATANDLIQRLGTRVTQHGSLPSDQVTAMLLESHVLCLPTWGDTYGYSVLEGQATGCATITTDLRALPEINNAACGWIVKVPKLPNGDGDLDTADKRATFRETLVAGLIASIREAHDDRAALHRKSVSALTRIRTHHDPESHAKRLKQIYQLAGK